MGDKRAKKEGKKSLPEAADGAEERPNSAKKNAEVQPVRSDSKVELPAEVFAHEKRFHLFC